jgi:solute carrier family 41
VLYVHLISTLFRSLTTNQVFVSISIAHLLTNLLWKRGLDPDMYALPIHSALMDLVGQTMLVLCFEIVSLLSGGEAIT